MLLFPDLPLPAAMPAPPLRPRSVTTWRRAVQVLACLLQMPIRAPLRALECDDRDDDAPTQRTVSATTAPAVKTTALSSIFTIADAAKAAESLRRCGRFGDAPGFTAPTRVERDGDRVRVIRLLPQETEEWQEKERIRRAKQRPPRPVKGAKTRGKKVRAWDGEVQ